MSGTPVGTGQYPLYYLHIPKTAGSSLTRLLRDAFAVDEQAAVGAFPDDYLAAGPTATSGCSFMAGHWGTLPNDHDPRKLATLCMLREPVARAWSHVSALRRQDPQTLAMLDPRAPDDPAGSLLREPLIWAAKDYQARWLSEPLSASQAPSAPGARMLPQQLAGPSRLPAAQLRARAFEALRQMAVVGPSERVDEVVDALARRLGRWLPHPPSLNAAPESADAPPAGLRSRLAELTALDRELHHASHRLLDAALEHLPPLPAFTARPVDSLPVRHTMQDRLAGTGWHDRVAAPPPVGWHRWTGPEVTSWLRLPWRLAGPAVLRVHVVSAVNDESLRGTRLNLQGRPLEFTLYPDQVGVWAVAEVWADPSQPLNLVIESGGVGWLTDPATGARSPDPAGLAIGEIEMGPVQ